MANDESSFFIPRPLSITLRPSNVRRLLVPNLRGSLFRYTITNQAAAILTSEVNAAPMPTPAASRLFISGLLGLALLCAYITQQYIHENKRIATGIYSSFFQVHSSPDWSSTSSEWSISFQQAQAPETALLPLQSHCLIRHI